MVIYIYIYIYMHGIFYQNQPPFILHVNNSFSWTSDILLISSKLEEVDSRRGGTILIWDVAVTISQFQNPQKSQKIQKHTDHQIPRILKNPKNTDHQVPKNPKLYRPSSNSKCPGDRWIFFGIFRFFGI